MSEVTNDALLEYCLRLGDNALILGHRLSEWCAHAPTPDEDVALMNIGLDLVGQARAFLTYAGVVEGKSRTEDDFAYLRYEREYRNCLLAEQPNGDFGETMARQFYIDLFHRHFYRALSASSDDELAAIAKRAVKETDYHARHSCGWIVRLGDGTEESHQRIQESINHFWMYVDELFEMDDVDQVLLEKGIAVDLQSLKDAWLADVQRVLTEATLAMPEGPSWQTGGKRGVHSEHLGYLLAELQYVQRAYPGLEW